jgi:hypothetical protein
MYKTGKRLRVVKENMTMSTNVGSRRGTGSIAMDKDVLNYHNIY